MKDVLFIKLSSLGDVVHQMPALREASQRSPGSRYSWAVEEAYVPLVRLHPDIFEVIPVPMRRWRSRLLNPSTWTEIRLFRQKLRERSYDTIIDTQGLLKSSIIGLSATGVRHGYDASSIKEPLSSLFNNVRHRVSWRQHAILRNKALTALALGYTPEVTVDYGLDRSRLAERAAGRYGVMLHGTARAEKEWPERDWRALTMELAHDFDLLLPAKSERERGRAERIIAGVSRASISEPRQLDGMARLIAGATFAVGVDTGLLHLAAALGVPSVAIFTDTDPDLHGLLGMGPIRLLGGRGVVPSVTQVYEAVREMLSLVRD